jgi:hypothetical protein
VCSVCGSVCGSVSHVFKTPYFCSIPTHYSLLTTHCLLPQSSSWLLKQQKGEDVETLKAEKEAEVAAKLAQRSA